MPKKIRELKAMVAKVGYILQQKRGKGSHTFWKHPLLPEEPLTIPQDLRKLTLKTPYVGASAICPHWM